jgi:hypothetical protein
VRPRAVRDLRKGNPFAGLGRSSWTLLVATVLLLAVNSVNQIDIALFVTEQLGYGTGIGFCGHARYLRGGLTDWLRAGLQHDLGLGGLRHQPVPVVKDAGHACYSWRPGVAVPGDSPNPLQGLRPRR